MTSPFCDMRCDCEECGDRQACDIYYAEKGFRLMEERFEEEYHERRHAEREWL
jgi:hypothetical protein